MSVLPVGMQTRLNAGRQRAALIVPALNAIGGSTWTQKRASGTGRTSRPTETTVATLTGYIYAATATRAASIPAPDFVPEAHLEFRMDGTASLLEDDTLTSTTDATLVYTVRSVEQRAGYTIATVEQP